MDTDYFLRRYYAYDYAVHGRINWTYQRSARLGSDKKKIVLEEMGWWTSCVHMITKC